MALTEKLTNIADAIRGKTGGTDLLTMDGMVDAINGLEIYNPYTWDNVFLHIAYGDYADVYKVGDCVPLDLGDEGIINMQIAAFDADDKADGSGKAPISWIGKELLKTACAMNSKSPVTLYEQIEVDAWSADGENKWVSYKGAITSDAVGTWTIAAKEDLALTVHAKCVGTALYQSIRMTDSNGRNYGGIATYPSGEGSHKINMTAGDTISLIITYKQTSYNGTMYGELSFSSDGEFDIEAEIAKTTIAGDIIGYKEGTFVYGGWAASELRPYLNDTVKSLLPETVRSKLVMVTKTQTAYDTSGSIITQSTEDELWLPSSVEIDGANTLYHELFKNTKAERIKCAYGTEKAANWWLRNASTTASDKRYACVTTTGQIGALQSTGSKNGVCLCFCT